MNQAADAILMACAIDGGFDCPVTVDYTIWRRQIFDDITEEEMDELIRHSMKDNPFEPEFKG